MIAIDETLISEAVLKSHFACDLAVCKGACCVEGDAGAPLDEDEIGLMEDNLDAAQAFMTPGGIASVSQSGVFDYDMFGHLVTPLVNGSECAFVHFSEGIAFCAFEMAYNQGTSTFRKPVSCHLYPIRISQYSSCDALNYHIWEVCKPAVTKGKGLRIALLDFLQVALVRKYGTAWYEKLKKALH